MLSTSYEVARIGITVPYGTEFDRVRQNHGYVELRGRPDLAAAVPEALESEALKELLVALAAPGSPIFSVGCDLGAHREPKARKALRHVAGGYVQVLKSPHENVLGQDYLPFAKGVAQKLEARAASHEWELRFELSSVVFKLVAGDPIPSVMVWFFARAPSLDEAVASREALIREIRRALLAV
jgi:hypothetical protein